MAKILPTPTLVNYGLPDAAAEGYKYRLHSDGNAAVTTPTGDTYQIQDFRCTCPDATNEPGQYCKHVVLLLQVRPCEHCGAVMIQLIDAGLFTCPKCDYARDVRIVATDRAPMFNHRPAPLLAASV